jgi:hypothetical protein
MLNDMRSAKSEHTEPVARGETIEELEAFLERERVEPYKKAGPNHHRGSVDYSHCFREGGPLEWFNDPLIKERHFIDIGTREEFVAKAAANAGNQWDTEVMGFLDASTT